MYISAMSNYTDNETRDTVTLLAMLEITRAYIGKALVKRNNMNKSISIIRQRLYETFLTFSAM